MDWRNRFFIFRCRTILVLAICIFAMCYYFRDYKPNHYMRTPIFFNDLVEPDANRTEVHQPSRKLNFLEKDQVLKEDDYAHSQNQLDRSETYEIRYSSEHDVNEVKERRLPQAIICGVKKGGTRALLEMLRLHPDVVAAGKEVHFFDSNYDLGLDWYREQMPESWQHQLTIEKTPSYHCRVNRDVPEKIYNMSRDVRFFLVVRDPVQRAISDYTQMMNNQNLPDAIEKKYSFHELAFFLNGTVSTDWLSIKRGRYAYYFRKWLKYFPRSQFHIIPSERLIKDPGAEIIAAQKFLGLRPLITRRNFVFDADKGFYCMRQLEGNQTLKCLGETKGLAHITISSSDEAELRKFYNNWNRQFYRIVGDNFGWK